MKSNYVEIMEVCVTSPKEVHKFDVEKKILDTFACTIVDFEMLYNRPNEFSFGNDETHILFVFKNLSFIHNAPDPPSKVVRLSDVFRKIYPGCKVETEYSLRRKWETHQTVSD